MIFVVYILWLLRLFGLNLVWYEPEQLHYQRHAHELAAPRLLKILGARVGVHLGRYLVDSRQWVQHAHVALCKAHLFLVEDIYAVETLILRVVRETLALDAGHIEYVELRHRLFERAALFILKSASLEIVVNYELRQAQLLGGDEHELYILDLVIAAMSEWTVLPYFSRRRVLL